MQAHQVSRSLSHRLLRWRCLCSRRWDRAGAAEVARDEDGRGDGSSHTVTPQAFPDQVDSAVSGYHQTSAFKSFGLPPVVEEVVDQLLGEVRSAPTICPAEGHGNLFAES